MLPPLIFLPRIKRLRWGGTRLASVLGKNIGQVGDAAESWELVDHGGDQSEVVAGEFQGWTLSRLVGEFSAELLGTSVTQTTFPLLVKYLDACDRLSLQVHPNDQQANQYISGERGKTEAWVVLEALPGSLIYAGLKPGVQRQDLKSAISQGKIGECVHSFEAQPGDCVHIPAGTVHAIGEGVLLIEIQQSSDITFRLHDWGRVGKDGQPRQLHLEQALECVDFTRGPVDPIQPEMLICKDFMSEDLVRSAYFRMRRFSGTRPWKVVSPDHFQILNVVAGNATLVSRSGVFAIKRGATVLIPACCRGYEIVPEGHCVVLETS
ncbi:MAG: gmuF [Planctomycetaceae bacterium]|nr:gmuF [Planctomycetaceae bacterium]